MIRRRRRRSSSSKLKGGRKKRRDLLKSRIDIGDRDKELFDTHKEEIRSTVPLYSTVTMITPYPLKQVK